MCRMLLLLFMATTVTAQQPSLFKAVSKGAEALIQIERANWPSYELKAGQSWLLNWSNSQRFDASGLLLLTNGDLLTLSDRGPSFYRIQFRTNSSIAGLLLTTECLITEVPEKEKPAPGGGGHGPGMGGMDY